MNSFIPCQRDLHLSDREARLNGLLAAATRSSLLQGLSEAFNSSTGEYFGVIVCDLDRFRRVNEALGHEAGNALIRLVAKRLDDAVAGEGRIEWIGGDQFVLALPELRTPDDLHDLIRRLRAVVAAPVDLEGRVVFATATFGSALRRVAPQSDASAGAKLMWLAETEMYERKAQRRPPSVSNPRGDALQLDTDLRGATERGELIAHFQPVYDARTGELAAFEALARWKHPSLGFVPPDLFIPTAEDNGLIHQIGAHILRAARSLLIQASGRAISMYVNVSTEQLAREGFAAEVAEIFEDFPLLLRRLVLEVTESSLILDQARLISELSALRSLGVGVAVDDFGSGYSSLLLLQELPVTELKIDRTLVQRDGAVGHAVLRAVMQLARGLGLTVVAEGVEQVNQLELLRELGSDRVQGFLFSPAVPADVALELASDLLPQSASSSSAPGRGGISPYSALR